MPSISDEIRVALDKPDGISEELMTPLAARYDREIASVNERLDEAVLLLRKNLRSEAVQSATRKPNVLNSASALDFPEVAEWYEILQFFGIPVPRRLDVEKVQMLNEAIVDSQPIEDLIRQHRRLAIARAPLNWRLSVLRRIAESDPGNPAWNEDVESYERERLKSLKSDVQAAIQSEDLNACHHLLSELTAQKWLTKPPTNLVPELKRFLAQAEHDRLLLSLRDLGTQLHDAQSKQNLQQARSLRENWHSTSAKLKSPLPTELVNDVEPILSWIQERDSEEEYEHQRSHAINGFRELMDRERDLSNLQIGFSRVAQFPPVPEDVENAYQSLVRTIEVQERRKSRLRNASVVAVVLLLVVGVLYWQWRNDRQNFVARTVANFADLVKSNRSAEASQYWSKVTANDPSLAQQPEMLVLKEQLDAQIAKDEERKREFEAYLARADNEDVSLIDESALRNAEKLASSEEEKRRVFEVQSKRNAYFQQLQAEHSENALAEIARIRTELDRLETQDLLNINTDEIDDLLARLQDVTREFPRRLPDVDAQVQMVQRQVKDFDAKVSSLQAADMVRKQARRPLEAARSIEKYHEALTRYAQSVQPIALTNELNQSASEFSRWQQGLKTNLLSEKARTMRGTQLSPAAIQSFLNLIKLAEAVNSANPLLAKYQRFGSQLNDVSDSKDEAIETLLERLDDFPIEDVVTVLVADGRSGDPRPVTFLMYLSDYQKAQRSLESEGSVGIKSLVNSSGDISTQVVKGPIERAHVEPGDTHRWLVDLIEDRSNGSLDADFENTLLKITQDMLGRLDLDCRVKEKLLTYLVECGVNGSTVLEEQLSGPLDFLKSRKPQHDLWYEPQILREQIQREVQIYVVDKFIEAVQSVSSIGQMLEELQGQEYGFAGFIDKSESGLYSPVVHTNPMGDGDAYVMKSDDNDPTKLSVEVIGRWQDGRIRLDSGNPEIRAGRPIFYIDEVR